MNKIKFFDPHIHINPDLYFRKYDLFTLGEELKKVDSCAVLKSHLCSTIIQAKLAQRLGYKIYGSIVLNRCSGGVDIETVKSAIVANENNQMLIYMPTLLNSQMKIKTDETIHPILNNLSYEDEIGESVSRQHEISEILTIASNYNIPIATGHMTKKDTEFIVNLAIKKGTKVILTHPLHKMIGLSIKELRDITNSKNIFMELTILMYVLEQQKEENIREVFNNINYKKIIVSSDLGQVRNCSVTKGYELYFNVLSRFLSQEMVESVIYRNMMDIFKTN
ncbi:MAG: hypothetical protein IJN54_04555 [Lachnospiraceae bacterium]|nr:hypothetical protein [Lachnospiraceae bacterium]